MKTIVIANPKGGVGKTTTALNLAASLAIAEKWVLLIDLDGSQAATLGVGLQPEQLPGGVRQLFYGPLVFEEIIHPLPYEQIPHLHMVPNNIREMEDERRLLSLAQNRVRLRTVLATIQQRVRAYDYVVIDTPAIVNEFLYSALVAAHSVIIPVQCGYFALKRTEQFLHFVARVQKGLNPRLKVEGILLTFFEKNTRVSHRALQEARSLFGDLVLDTIIPKNTHLGLSAFERKPIALMDATSTGAQAYLRLAREIIGKDEQQESATLYPRSSQAQ